LGDDHFYESIGRVTSDAIEYYITWQQGKHWDGKKNNVLFRYEKHLNTSKM